MTEGGDTVTDTRLIERWLPIAALGEESIRERRSIDKRLPPDLLPPRLVGAAAAGGFSGGGPRIAVARGCRPGEVPACAGDPRRSGGYETAN